MDVLHRSLLRAVMRAAVALLIAPADRIAVARVDLLDALARLGDELDAQDGMSDGAAEGVPGAGRPWRSS